MRTLSLSTIAAIALSVATLPTGATHAADTYPSKAVTLVVGFSAGSSIDLVARVLAKNLSASLKQPVIVENRSGAGGNVAAEHVSRAPADGHTILVVANSIAISPALYKDLKFDVNRDLKAVAYVGKGPVILKVRKSLGTPSLAEFLAYAKANPDKLNYGSSGVGGTPHMATVLFEQLAGIRMTHIPFKGGADALAALIGGHVDLLINPLLGDTRSDKVDSLAITAEARSSQAEGVPTFKELGFGKYDIGVYYGLMAPAGTPAASIETLNAAVGKALGDPDVVAALTERSGIALTKMSAAGFQAFLDADQKLWRDVVAKGGVTVK